MPTKVDQVSPFVGVAVELCGKGGSGLGCALLRDAVLRISAALHEVGIAAILVHALNDHAKAFCPEAGIVETAV